MKHIFTTLAIAMAGGALTTAAQPAVKRIPTPGDAIIAPSSAIAREADTDTWKPLGTGKYRETLIHAHWVFSSFPEIEVEIEESEQHPGRYRLVNPYANYNVNIFQGGLQEGDHYMIVDASDPEHVFLELSETGVILGLNGEDEPLIMWAWSMADDYRLQYGSENWKTLADRDGVSGHLTDGHITFGPGVLTSISALVGSQLNPIDRPGGKIATEDGFRIKLPSAPDIDIIPTFSNISDDGTKLIYDLHIDKDPEKVLVALVEGQYTDQMPLDIANGTIPSQTITETGDVKVEIPYTADGVWTLVCVPYWQGHASMPAHFTSELNFSEAEWRKAGTATYTEGLMSSNELTEWGQFVFDVCTYPVEVQEDVKTPGRIRLVDPYGPNYQYHQPTYYDNTRHWYLVIDASNPEKVEMEYCEGVGLDLGAGKMELWGRTARYRETGIYTEKEIDDMQLYGRFANDQITFPNDAIVIRFENDQAKRWYYANCKGNFKLEFEKGQLNGSQAGSGAVSSINDDTDAPEVYYTLDGIKADAANLTPGIYIVRKGSQSYKKVVK